MMLLLEWVDRLHEYRRETTAKLIAGPGRTAQTPSFDNLASLLAS